MNGATAVDEIADGIYRICTHLPGFGSRTGIEFSQFLVNADEPLLVHTGMRGLFADVVTALSRVIAVSDLRWLTFGHVEGDECGALAEFLAAAPNAHIAFSAAGCLATVDDMAAGRARPIRDGETLDLGGRRLRTLATPHVPHNWEAQVLYEEVTGTLFCGDLLAQAGHGPAVVEELGFVERALATNVALVSSPPGPALPATLHRLAELDPVTLAVMHGSCYSGDGADALRLFAAG